MGRGLKFQIKEAEGLYYLHRENKGTDQLCDYCTADSTADPRLCFRICKNPAHIIIVKMKIFSLVLNYACIYSATELSYWH